MKLFSTIIIFILIAFSAVGQAVVEVKPGASNTLTYTGADNPLKLPFSLRFKKTDFDGKVINVYSSKNDNEKIGGTTMKSPEIRTVTSGGADFFELTVDGKSKLKMPTSFSVTNPFYLRLGDKGSFNKDIKIEGAVVAGGEGGAGDGEKVKPVEGLSGGTYPVYDALEIAEQIRNGNKGAAYVIMEKYGSAEDLAKNHFLAYDKAAAALARKNLEDLGLLQAGEGLLGVLSGGLNVTNIADGFAKFIVKRTKEELSIAFFQKFKDELDKHPDLPILFPDTYKLLKAIDQDIYNYSTYINNLRDAFRSDLQTIDEHLPALVDAHPEIFEKDEYFLYGAGIKTGSFVTTSLRHEMHPGDIIDTYPVNDFLKGDKRKNLRGAFQLLQLLNETLKLDPDRNQDSDGYWAEITVVRAMIANPEALKIYIGLTLELSRSKYSKVEFEKSNFYDVVNTKKNADDFLKNYNDYKRYILELSSRVNELKTLIKNSTEANTDSLRVELYASYFKSTAGILEYSLKSVDLPYVKDIPGIDGLKNNKDVKKAFDASYEVADLATAINRKRYPEAINHAVNIYEILFGPVAAKEPTPGATTQSTLAAIAKYGSFMSSIVMAKNSDEIAEAIEAAALPVGSARIKRETYFNVSLNAYCGLFVGGEKIRNLESDEKGKFFNAYGITAPIGVSISTGRRGVLPFLPFDRSKSEDKDRKRNWSHSLFISIVDIGAITAYRFGNSEVAQVPDIKFKDIFSPGAFWSLGIPKTPLSLNMGVQVGPNLREVKVDANSYADNLYVRYSASLCVDIPLVNFYTKSERVKK